MTRRDLIAAVSQTAQVSLEDASRCITALFGDRREAGLIARRLGKGDRIQLPGFGTFEARHRPERWGHNPSNGARIRIAERTGVGFRAALALRQRLQAPAGAPDPDPAV